MSLPPDEKGTRKEAATSSPTEQQFQAFLESAPDAVVIVDAQGKISNVNQQTERLFGYAREQLLGQPVEILIPVRHRAAHVADRTEYTESPRVRPMGAGLDLRGVRKDGTEFPVEISLSPVESSAGLRVFSTIRDVTLSKRTEEQLREARSDLEIQVQERTAEMVQAVRDLGIEVEQHRQAVEELARERDRAKHYLDIAEVALLALDKSGRIVMINRKGLRTLGYDEKELTGQDWFTTCIPKRHREQAREMFGRLLNGQPVDYIDIPVLTKEGEERLIVWHNTVLSDPAGNTIGTLSSGEDITEQRRSQETVKKLAAIVESSEDAIIGKSLDGIITSWNAAAERLYGYSAAEAIGRSFTMLVPPEGVKAVAEILKRLKQGERIRGMEAIRVTKDGRRVNISLTASPVFDDHGNPIAGATIARDITDRVKLEQQLRQAHKMEAIGRLAGGVAHDFNNLLGVILGDSELLLADQELGTAQRKEVEEIKEAGEQAAALTRQLMAFSRQQILETQVLDLNTVLGGFENILQRLVGPEIALQLVLAPDLGPVRADANQLLQVILNLVVNARDAMPRGGKLRIEAANVALETAQAASHPGVMPGRHVQISVADNGPGMDRETLAHIFEPFFTTKGIGQGAGMGLATAYGIVQQIGGSIWAYSEPGNGATFKIFLPQEEEAGAPAVEAQTKEELLKGTETVLLVEDAGLLRRVTGEFLERIGYTVLAAEDGPKALAVSSQYNGKIHLLLTDLAMPGMNGQELAERLVETRPGLKVLYTSGYANSILADQPSASSRFPFIEKPFTWQNLALKVRDVLDRQ
ncbi:MAG TPA: PAS domain S-box protein [Patescibacteria group bacterium]|nr:PAS domain S-box protein [Patescibacteria group bacterium]